MDRLEEGVEGEEEDIEEGEEEDTEEEEAMGAMMGFMEEGVMEEAEEVAVAVAEAEVTTTDPSTNELLLLLKD